MTSNMYTLLSRKPGERGWHFVTRRISSLLACVRDGYDYAGRMLSERLISGRGLPLCASTGYRTELEQRLAVPDQIVAIVDPRDGLTVREIIIAVVTVPVMTVASPPVGISADDPIHGRHRITGEW